jgi:hypothetical protein
LDASVIKVLIFGRVRAKGKKTMIRKMVWLLTIAVAGAAAAQTSSERWTAQQANSWYEKQPWLVGANFIPSNAINEFEMFQAATFDPAINDKELAMAESIGMNTVRVFLQDQLWQQDSKGFTQRLDTFLGIAAKHHIKPLLVLFDSCWESDPRLGPQHPPIPGIHNSGWVQSPGKARLHDRSAHPIQPLTSGVWVGNWDDPAKETETTQTQLRESDVITFHNYGWPEEFEARIQSLQKLGRPIICTEYMARGAGSTFDGSLPVAKKYHVGAINWGLVAGKTQTYFPWDSWQRPYVLAQPTVWFHEVFKQDDTPYRQREVDLIRELTARGDHRQFVPFVGLGL